MRNLSLNLLVNLALLLRSSVFSAGSPSCRDSCRNIRRAAIRSSGGAWRSRFGSRRREVGLCGVVLAALLPGPVGASSSVASASRGGGRSPSPLFPTPSSVFEV